MTEPQNLMRTLFSGKNIAAMFMRISIRLGYCSSVFKARRALIHCCASEVGPARSCPAQPTRTSVDSPATIRSADGFALLAIALGEELLKL